MASTKINIGIDIQKYYDNLVLLRRSIDAQIKELESDVLICTHDDFTVIEDGKFEGDIFCNNPNCGKLLLSKDGRTQINGGSK